MIIIYCSKQQQTDDVTPTPLAHRSHTCMRALALGHDGNTEEDTLWLGQKLNANGILDKFEVLVDARYCSHIIAR